MALDGEQVIKCPNCGQLNRINGPFDGKRPICAKCWTALMQTDREFPSSQGTTNCQNNNLTLKSELASKKGWIIALVIGGFIVWLISQNSTPSSNPQKPLSPLPKRYVSPSPGYPNKNDAELLADLPSKTQAFTLEEMDAREGEIQEQKAGISPKPSYPPVHRPKNGHAQVYTRKERIAPLEITTDNSSDFLVKLVDMSTNDQALNVFVRRGSTAEIEVPLGIYEIRYASGETWYGYDYLFGPETSYNKADELFEFKRVGDRVSGFTVTLYKIENGNLSTSQIRPSQF